MSKAGQWWKESAEKPAPNMPFEWGERLYRWRYGKATGRQPLVHELKTWPEYYCKVKSGCKPFEIRLNDRQFAVGDTLHLREWCPYDEAYTGDSSYWEITYIYEGPAVQPGYVVLGIASLIEERGDFIEWPRMHGRMIL